MLKKCCLTCCLLVLFAVLYGQNWQPFALGESHHYRSDTGTWINRTIRIDSVRGNFADSIWYFPRLLHRLSDANAVINVPHFCQRSMRVQGNGRFQFFDPGNIYLDSKANLGDLALVDSIGNATGLVTRIYAGNVLGEADSLKVIMLTTGDSLLLSKAHGLVEWPASLGPQRFVLVGLQSKHLGDTLPGFEGFFKYKAGDVYYWKGGGSRQDNTRPTYPLDTWYQEFKIKILSVLRDSAGLHMTVERTNTEDPRNWRVDTTVSTISRRQTGLVEAGPDEMVHCGPSIEDYFLRSSLGFVWQPFCADLLGTQRSLYAAAHYEHRPYRTILSFGQTNDQNYWYHPFPNLPSDTLDNFYLVEEGLEIAEGLGFRSSNSTARGFYASTYWWSLNMVGYVIDGDSVGTIILPEPAPISLEDWSIWPNPANDIVHFRIPSTIGGTIHLIDMAGRIVRSYNFEGAIAEVPVADLRPGIYVLRYTQGETKFSKRFAVFH
jgi:hypothetical protein